MPRLGHSVLRISHGSQKLQSLRQVFLRRQEFIFPVNAIVIFLEGQLVILAHHDRFFRADFFAEAAENAAKHIDLESNRIALFQ
jgi:hypothetical protein